MFAECGYDLILGFRENISAAEKFKSQLLDKYQSLEVSYVKQSQTIILVDQRAAELLALKV